MFGVEAVRLLFFARRRESPRMGRPQLHCDKTFQNLTKSDKNARNDKTNPSQAQVTRTQRLATKNREPAPGKLRRPAGRIGWVYNPDRRARIVLKPRAYHILAAAAALTLAPTAHAVITR